MTDQQTLLEINFDRLPDIRTVSAYGLTAQQLLSMVIGGMLFNPASVILKHKKTGAVKLGLIPGPCIFVSKTGGKHYINETIKKGDYHWLVIALNNKDIKLMSVDQVRRKFHRPDGDPSALLHELSKSAKIKKKKK